MQQLTYYDFKIEGNQLIMIRNALLHTILSSTKHCDGYSRLIFKSDLDKLKGNLKAKSLEVESLLKDAWVKCCNAENTNLASLAFGKMCVRMCLLLLGKQKFSRDKYEVDSFAQIIELFAADLAGEPTMAAPTHAKDQEQGKVKDLLQASPAEVALLQHKHIKLGCRPDLGEIT